MYSCGSQARLDARTEFEIFAARHSNSLRASNFAQSPPTLRGNCSERLWLHARAFLVVLENRLGWPGEVVKRLPDVRFLFSPFLPTFPLWPPKLEYNAVSAEVDEIW